VLRCGVNTSNPLETLIASARILRETNPEVCFLIVGSAIEEARWRSLRQAWECSFSDPVKKSQVHDLLAGSIVATIAVTQAWQVWPFPQ